jgi:hypothetical protein
METTSKACMALAVCGATVALILAGSEHDRVGDVATGARDSSTGATLGLRKRLELRHPQPAAERAPVVAADGARAAEERGQPTQAADPTTDPIGMTDAQRMTALMRAHEMIALSQELHCAETVALAELNFLRRAIGTILHHRGRARFVDDEVRASGGFRMGRSEHGEFSFVQDCALYQYDRGEFPTHDIAYDIRYGKALERPSDMDDRIHAMLLEALDTLETAEAR